MPPDYFGNYSNKQLEIVEMYVSKTSWIKDEILDIIEDSTSFHDVICTLKSGKTLIIQVKEEEAYWFTKTNNLGLDYISAFDFIRNSDEYLRTRWIKPEDHQKFLDDIEIRKWGKLITCDADVHLFYVKGVGFWLYDNHILQSYRTLQWLKSNYKLRINDKKQYGIEEDWDSAAFFVKPSHQVLIQAKIDNLHKLFTAIDTNSHDVNRRN